MAFPLVAAYSISKAAAFSMTQSLRALLTVRGVSVHAVLAGPIDTDMSRDADLPKSSPEFVARGDPKSASMAESWRSGAAKALIYRP